MSADYRLMPPVTGHDIIEDIKDVFRFISEELNTKLSKETSAGRFYPFHVDSTLLLLPGLAPVASARIMPDAYNPKPRALVLMYAMGGDYLVRGWLH